MGEDAVCMQISMDVDIGKETTPSTELNSDHKFSTDEAQPEDFPNKKQAREASYEDLKSEVTNPLISPRENVCGGQDITSQPTESAWSNHTDCNQVSSSSSGNSETLSDEGNEPSHGNDTTQKDAHNDSSSVTMSHVTLEIPEHVSSTGIRKITFKFSKKKDDSITDAIVQGQAYNEEFQGNHSNWVDPNVGISEGRDNYLCTPNMELKMSKKVVPSNYPTNVKKLLSTGILDGARVKYISPKRELEGIVDGGGYLCGCSLCNYSRILSAYEFELHAGAKTRHPNNHIYLENGKPIYSIIQELKTAPLDMLDEVIKDVAGSSINKEYFQDWIASLHQSTGTVGVNRPYYRKHPSPPYSLVKSSNEALEENYPFVHDSPFRKQTYMETSDHYKRATKRSRSYISNSVTKVKKTTECNTKKRDNDLHRLLFIPGGLPDGAELAYYVKGQKLLEGYKQGNGIVCNCCDREISPSQFEAHAGMAARRQPYRHIYTSNGLTLHDIAMSLASGQNIKSGVSDDMCAKCGEGGDLLCCESCPQAFHPACLGLENAPESSWCCPNCISGHGGNSARSIMLRLTRVVKTPESEAGGCVICRSHDFSTNICDERTVILCDQCEKEFHIGCLRDGGVCDLKEIPKDNWFCCDDCHRIFIALQNSVSSGVQIAPATQFDIINRKYSEKGFHINASSSDVQWRILMGKSRKIEDLPLLSAAAAIFRECFDPIVAKSGRDLIPVMVYGRNISGQEFGGMYCILLTVRDIVISAGLIRVFGKDVAELPLVATSKEFQGKGYFQALFSCIERLLCSLGVETLVLPATEEAESIWTNKFGFQKMNDERLSKYSSLYQLTVFRGTSMLEKEVQQTIC